MFRFVLPGAVPPGLLSRILHPSIDRLIALGRTDPQDNAEAAAAKSREFSAILCHITIGGIYKRTKQRRLPEGDRALAAQLRAKSVVDSLDFLDVGGSDGVTTRDTVNHLEAALGIKVRGVLADRTLWISRSKKGVLVEYTTAAGEPILLRWGVLGLVLNWPSHRRAALQKAIVNHYLAFQRFRRSMRLTAKVPLVNPIVSADSRIRLFEMDIFEFRSELAQSMDVVRASNILNLEYFSAPKIATAIANLHAYLRPGGSLLISRNVDEATGEVEHGSIWSKKKDAFAHETDFGKGSEIRHTVDDWKRDALPTAITVSN